MQSAESISLPFTDTDRDAGSELDAQVLWVAEYPGIYLFDDFPVAVMIFNRHRQIVYYNRRSASLLPNPEQSPIGLRPGEAFGCIHAFENPGGCGTARFCQYCGAARGIASALSGALDVEQCKIDRSISDHRSQLDLLVWTKPFTTHEQLFIIAALIDISAEQRRDTFERIFLHDLLNTATSIHSVLNLMEDASSAGTPDREYLNLARLAADQLTEEIQTHRSIWDAEQGVLAVNAAVVSLGDLLRKVGTLYNYMAEERGITVVVRACPEKKIISDEVLLKRVVSNLVKNAIEACHSGETVTLECRDMGGYIEIHVSNPALISEEVQSNLFKRSYSTKAKGRGWGTYAARLFVEEYLGGRIGFESVPGKGTVFVIQLPDDPVFPPAKGS